MTLKCRECNRKMNAKHHVSAIVVSKKGVPYCDIRLFHNEECMLIHKGRCLNLIVVSAEQLTLHKYRKISLQKLLREVGVDFWHANKRNTDKEVKTS